MPTPEPEHITAGSGDAIAEAWAEYARRAEPVLDQFRGTILRLSDVLLEQMFPSLQRLFEQLDPKVQARIRQGHPAYPRRQVIHNGGKP